MRDFTRVVIITLIILLTIYVFKITRIGREPINLLPNVSYAIQFVDDFDIADDGDDLLWLKLSESSKRDTLFQYVWYKIPTPIIDDAIGIYFTELKTSEYQLFGSDGQLIASDAVDQFSYNRFAFIESIPQKYSSDALYLRVSTNVHFKHLSSAVYIGDYDELNAMFTNYNLTDVIFGIAFLVIGLGLLIVSFLFRQKQRVMNLSLGGFFINIGFIFMLSQTNFIFYFSDLHDFFRTLYIINLLLVPLMTIHFYEAAMISKKSSMGVSITKTVFMIFTAITALSLFILIQSNYRFDLPFTILFSYLYPVFVILLGLALIIISFIESNEQRIYARIFLNGLLILAISLIVNVIFKLLTRDIFISPSLWKGGVVMLSVNLMAIAVNQMLVYRRTKYSTIKLQGSSVEYDYVTNLPNQIGILRQLDMAIRNHRITGESFSCAMLNIDNLSAMNDRYGYVYGDELILSLVGLCYEHFGKDIILGRYSDAIFFVILPATKGQKAYHLLESFREKVKFTNHSYDNQMVHFTISVSLMEHQMDDDINQLLYKLNQAMYFAKNHGKDVCIDYTQVTGR